MMAVNSDMVSYEDAAQMFGRAEATIRDWARRGYIRRYTKPLDKRVYVSVKEIRALLNGEFRPKDGGSTDNAGDTDE